MRRGASPARSSGSLRVSGVVTSPRRRILVVEDEASLALTLSDRLVSEGYEVQVAEDGDAGYEAALQASFDMIVLDLNLPKRNGFDVCRDLRQRGYAQPILMLTARGQVVDKVVGLKLGGDDYLTKPFEMAELLVRIEALLRRPPPPTGGGEGTFVFGEVRVDFRRAEITRSGSAVELAPLELKLLRYFIEHRGDVILPLGAPREGVGLRQSALHANRRRARRGATSEARARSLPPGAHPHGSRPRLSVLELAADEHEGSQPSLPSSPSTALAATSCPSAFQ